MTWIHNVNVFVCIQKRNETKQTWIDRRFIGFEFNSLPMLFDDKREKS